MYVTETSLSTDSSRDLMVFNWSECQSWNVTFCFNLTGDGSSSEPVNYWAIVLVLFPLLTVFGNSLVVLSVVRDKTLRTVTNYFIVSLATSDIMVALLVMPLSIYGEVRRVE